MLLLLFLTILQPLVYCWAYRKAKEVVRQRRQRQSIISEIEAYTERRYDRLICDLGFSSWVFIFPFMMRKTWYRSVKQWKDRVYWDKHWTVGIISIAKFLSECLAAYVDIVEIKMLVAAMIADPHVQITWSLVWGKLWSHIGFLVVLSIKFFGERVYEFTSTLVRSGLPSTDAIILVLLGLLDTGTIIVNLLNLQTIDQDLTFSEFPAVKPMLDVLFAFFMFRVFILVPGILFGVMWRDESANRPTPKTFIYDMIFNNYIVLIFILLGRVKDLDGFRFKNVYMRSKNSVGMMVGFLMIKGICCLFLCGFAFRTKSLENATQYIPITLAFTVLHMLVSFMQLMYHRICGDDEDDNVIGSGGINVPMLRHATPTAPQEPIRKEDCYQIFRLQSWKWRSAVIAVLCGMFVISMIPLMPAAPSSIAPTPSQITCPMGPNQIMCSGHGDCVLKPKPNITSGSCVCKVGWTGVACSIRPSPCYNVDCGHGECQAIPPSPSPLPSKTELNGGLLAGVVVLNLFLIGGYYCVYLTTFENGYAYNGRSQRKRFIFLLLVLVPLQIWGSYEWVAHEPITVASSSFMSPSIAGLLPYKCICDKQWVGTPTRCVDCVSGYFGPACNSVCAGGATNPCSGYGQCSEGPTGTGKCTCNSGVSGNECNSCPENHFGHHCEQSCPGGGTGSVCSGHGTCDAGTPSSSGKCECSSGWTGTDWCVFFSFLLFYFIFLAFSSSEYMYYQ